MRKNYFAKLMKYIKNVYNIERGINKLSDTAICVEQLVLATHTIFSSIDDE